MSFPPTRLRVTAERAPSRLPFPMSTHNYPGRGLSLSQLTFALNEELKRVAYSPLYVAKRHFRLIEEQRVDHLCSFTFDSISQIDRDASTALATIREWRNSFIPINRIPTDILSLIPTHLPTQKDRFHAASVCRHWRGILLKHGALWSQLFLGKGEECVSTLLERAKGSALDIITDRNAPDGIITLISPRAQQIAYLEFVGNYWRDILAFSELNSGQLPLLRTLKITSYEDFGSDGQRIVKIPPSLRLFEGSINLQRFELESWRLSSLTNFVFPNLTTFKLLPSPTEDFNVSYLFNFLKASPLLQTVEMDITAKIDLSNIPQEIVIVLPNVKIFSLHVPDDTLPQVFDFASHMSCPCAQSISLAHETYDDDMNTALEVFPSPVVWDTIVRQYTASPVEEVTLEIKRCEGEETICSLTFCCSDAIVVKLGFTIHETGSNEDDLNMSLPEMGWEIFSQALTTIQNHPLLSHVKRFHIKEKADMPDTYQLPWVANKFRKLFRSLGPLDEFTIGGCDLHIFLVEFLDLNNPALNHSAQPIIFPQVKEFKVLYLSSRVKEEECMETIVDLAESQHALGVPFERVKVRMVGLHPQIAEELGRWVAVVDCDVWGIGEGEDL